MPKANVKDEPAFSIEDNEPSGADETEAAEQQATPPEPQSSEQLYESAKKASEVNDLPTSARLYNRLLQSNPGHVGARNNLALVYDRMGDQDMAVKELTRCLDYSADNHMVLLNRANVLAVSGQYGDAERDLRRIIEADSANMEAHFNLGVVLCKKGLWADAIAHLRTAVELDPSNAAGHHYLGEALNHVDDLNGALQAYQRATELRPSHRNALYGMGIVLDRLNRPDEAAEMYRRSREVSAR